MKNKNRGVIIIAMGALGKGISGGDRIFTEFARRWTKVTKVSILLWDEGMEMCKRVGLNKGNNIEFRLINIPKLLRWNFAVCYITRIVQGVFISLSINRFNIENGSIIYSASEFWMDSIPAWIIKLRFPDTLWVASWYQTAPNPILGFSESNRVNNYRFSSLLYWLMQLPIKPLIANFSDFILVNNENERHQFNKQDQNNRVIVVFGAVDLARIKKFKDKSRVKIKAFEGVFQGRFHPQKGVVELIEIWRNVVKKKPKATLAMIGDGPLMSQVKQKIEQYGLVGNVKLFGYLFDGEEKYRIFQSSKIVLHPSFFDSGGMASAEAMAFGIPCIGFNLKAYETYYPKGMVKVKVGDIDEFSSNIIKLLDNKIMYKKFSYDAYQMIKKDWSWDKRAEEIYIKINKTIDLKVV